MKIKKTFSGFQLSAMVNGIRYAKHFIGYSLPEAMESFKAELTIKQTQN